MKNIVVINGSPKTRNSSSAKLTECLQELLLEKLISHQAVQLLKSTKQDNDVASILKAEIIVFIFPLYIDALPAPLVKVMNLLQAALSMTNPKNRPKIYAIVNCGFYEAAHTATALQIVENFADECDLRWIYGIGLGCGAAIQSFGENLRKSPAAGFIKALEDMTRSFNDDPLKKDNVFIEIRYPRFLYHLTGNFQWRQIAKRNGVLRSINAQPHKNK